MSHLRCTQGPIARSSLRPIKSSQGNHSLLPPSKNMGPSPLKSKQLQTPNIYWETCASHQTKTRSLYPAELQGLIDHKLLYVHTYMSFQCIFSMCVCVYGVSKRVSVSLSLCVSNVFMSVLACLPLCVFCTQTCMHAGSTYMLITSWSICSVNSSHTL